MPPKGPSGWLKFSVSVSMARACCISSSTISKLKSLLKPGALGPQCQVKVSFFLPLEPC